MTELPYFAANREDFLKVCFQGQGLGDALARFDWVGFSQPPPHAGSELKNDLLGALCDPEQWKKQFRHSAPVSRTNQSGPSAVITKLAQEANST